MRIYVASSWRNHLQPLIVTDLRDMGHEVYDFKNPPAKTAFHWSEIHRMYKHWTPDEYVRALNHPIALDGFCSDYNAMLNAEVCVLVLPCGRSAHLEAGYFVGAQKKLCIMIEDVQSAVDGNPELMYKMADMVAVGRGEMLHWARGLLSNHPKEGLQGGIDTEARV